MYWKNDTEGYVYVHVAGMIKVCKVADRHYQGADILELSVFCLLTASLLLTE